MYKGNERQRRHRLDSCEAMDVRYGLRAAEREYDETLKSMREMPRYYAKSEGALTKLSSLRDTRNVYREQLRLN